ncbi:MAG: hypothetical protein AAF934_10105 [Bacteroidota bacterium]
MLYPKTDPNIEQLREKLESGEISRAEFKIQKKPYTFFGYETKKRFWYAIGQPLTILYFSLMLLYTSTYIVFKELKILLRIATFIGASISFYFIVWTFWYRGDFPLKAYYISIGIISLLSAYVSYLLIVFRDTLLVKIKILTSFIVEKGRSHVPKENEEAYVSDYLETLEKLIE